MPVSKNTRRRAVAVTNPRGERTVATSISPAVCLKLEAICREQRTTKSAVLRDLVEERVNLEGHE